MCLSTENGTAMAGREGEFESMTGLSVALAIVLFAMLAFTQAAPLLWQVAELTSVHIVLLSIADLLDPGSAPMSKL